MFVGPYNQAIQVDNHLYVAGNVGFIPETMEIIEGGVVAETTQALTNMSKQMQATAQYLYSLDFRTHS